MLQKFTFAVLALLTVQAYAQQKIEGLGIFKFGRSPAETVQEYAKSHKMPIIKVSSVGFDEKPNIIRQLVYKPAQPSQYQSVNASACPETEVYYLSSYTISGIELTNLYLTYYRQGLIKIRSDGSTELDDALKVKYGEPERTSRKEYGKCGEQGFLIKKLGLS